jgi:hypothetical protein
MSISKLQMARKSMRITKIADIATLLTAGNFVGKKHYQQNQYRTIITIFIRKRKESRYSRSLIKDNIKKQKWLNS